MLSETKRSNQNGLKTPTFLAPVRWVVGGFGIPWLDRRGRFSWLKMIALLFAVAPAVALAGRWVAGDLGAQPVTEAIDTTGLWTIRFVLITLSVTPLRRLLDWPGVTVLRRMLGLAATAYVLLHLGLYAYDQKLQIGVVAREIASRIYLTIGFVALLGVCVLGLTSTDEWMRRLGRNWKRLHRIIFAIGVLGLVHFFMQSKVDVSEAVLTAGFFAWLILWRALPSRKKTDVLTLVLLSPFCGILAAFIEFAWYGLATGVRAARVLASNLDISFGLRPAVWVGLTAFGVAGVTGIKQLATRAAVRANARRQV